jgi:hypothetical protein
VNLPFPLKKKKKFLADFEDFLPKFMNKQGRQVIEISQIWWKSITFKAKGIIYYF